MPEYDDALANFMMKSYNRFPHLICGEILRKVSVPVEFVPWVCHIGFAHRSSPQYWNPFHTPSQYQFFDVVP
eukprot:7359168-Karenia_brevis.AAC.1